MRANLGAWAILFLFKVKSLHQAFIKGELDVAAKKILCNDIGCTSYTTDCCQNKGQAIVIPVFYTIESALLYSNEKVTVLVICDILPTIITLNRLGKAVGDQLNGFKRCKNLFENFLTEAQPIWIVFVSLLISKDLISLGRRRYDTSLIPRLDGES